MNGGNKGVAYAKAYDFAVSIVNVYKELERNPPTVHC